MGAKNTQKKFSRASMAEFSFDPFYRLFYFAICVLLVLFQTDSTEVNCPTFHFTAGIKKSLNLRIQKKLLRFVIVRTIAYSRFSLFACADSGHLQRDHYRVL